MLSFLLLKMMLLSCPLVLRCDRVLSFFFFQTPFSFHSSQGFRCDSSDPSSHCSPTSLSVIYTDKRFQHSKQPQPDPKAQAVGPHSPPQ